MMKGTAFIKVRIRMIADGIRIPTLMSCFKMPFARQLILMRRHELQNDIPFNIINAS